MRRIILAAGSMLAAIAVPNAALAETEAIVMVCAKGTTCNEQTARSVYHVPMQGIICFVPIQHKLAEMNVYDEKTDDIKIKCRAKG